MNVSECDILEAHSCKSDMKVVDVAKELKKESTKHIVIVDSKNVPVGIISSVDIVNKVVAEEKNPAKVLAKDIMTKDMFKADVSEEVGKVYYGMIKRNVFFCPVTEDNKLKGIVTLQGIMKNIVVTPRRE